MLTKALRLARFGFAVFPLRAADKSPLTENGHLDATHDEAAIRSWWAVHPDAIPGIHTGRSGVVVLDIDRKNGKDGFETLDLAWKEIPDTFGYATPNDGFHKVYRAPEGIELAPAAPYSGLEGVDRRGGSSYVAWWGEVPVNPDDIVPAPEWLCEVSARRTGQAYQGTQDQWLDELTPGEPNKLVRDALDRIDPDMGHGEMVEAQFNAVRLGAEGAPGVLGLLDALLAAWLARDPDAHSTPEQDWHYKFDEALASAIDKYGKPIERLEKLPAYDLAQIPSTMNVDLLVGASGDKADFSRALGALIETGADDDRIASTLWSAPKTKELAREWGIEFVYERVTSARTRPEPERENPSLEEQAGASAIRIGLLSEDEKAYIATRPTFIDRYMELGAQSGFANPIYFRATAWTVLSMAFAFRGFIPVSGTDKMGLNLWGLDLGYSGTGKTRAIKFRDSVLDLLYKNEQDDAGYNLGGDSSPAGLQLALLQRDRQPSFLGVDEGSRFFEALAKQDWMSGLDSTLSHWYEGKVDASNKISLKELKGKTALTSFSIEMFATPDRLTQVVTRDMFGTGFLARFHWVLGDPPTYGPERFIMSQQEEPTDFDQQPQEVMDLALDLAHAARLTGEKPTPVLADEDALKRMGEAHAQMFNQAKTSENWDIIEPSLTRLAESIRKCAALCALYRGSDRIEWVDALHAIAAVEEWYENLFTVTAMISAGEFQNDVDKMEQWIAARGGSVTKTALYHNFRNMIQKDPRELDSRVNFLVESGRVNRKEEGGKPPKFLLNGG